MLIPVLRPLLTFSLLLLGGFASAASAAEEPKTLTPRGIVVDANQKPIAGADVTLHRWNGDNYGPALGTMTTDTAGTFTFPARPEDAYYYVFVRRAPYAAWSQLATSDASSKITLKPVVETWSKVLNGEGKPLEGARIANLSIRMEENGTEFVFRGMEQLMGWTFGPSDITGRLDLPPLPDGALVDIQIDHPNWAQAKLKNQRITKGLLGTITLPAGVPTTFEFVADPRTPTALDDLTVQVNMMADTAPEARLSRRPLAIVGGRAELSLPAVTYQYVTFDTPKVVITPAFPESSKGLVISPGERNHHRFLVRKTLAVSGRVVAPDGAPHKGAWIYGRVENLSPDGTVPKDDEWTYAGFTETDAEGKFTSMLPPGRCLLQIDVDRHLTDRDEIEIDIPAEGSVTVMDVVARPLEPLRGRVVGLDGKPVAGAIVRPRHPSIGRRPPVISNDAGRFEIVLRSVPTDLETRQRRLEFDIAAYVADEPISGRVRVDLRRPEALQNLEILLQRESSAEALFEFEDTQWQKAQLAKRTPERMDRYPTGRTGEIAPDLDGVAWFNTDARSLKEFRGRYVLLDFWFTGCGPCHADFPFVKLVHERFEKLGVTVIGVHDNSSTPDAVREHCRELGLTFPIVVDHPNGRILDLYRQLGVDSFPSYILVGPDGMIVQNDATTQGPKLGSHKIEVIRKHVLARDAKP